MKTNYLKMLAAVLGMLVSFSARAELSAIDKDGDGVFNWEDYCPNTPAGKMVWTAGRVFNHPKGNAKWIGCAGESVEKADPGYILPPRPPSASEGSYVAEGLSPLTENLSKSFESLANASVKPKALIYHKGVSQLRKRTESRSVTGVVESLCGSQQVLEALLPVMEGTSSRIFEKPTQSARELNQLLALSVGNSCEGLHVHSTAWSLMTDLELMQAGWNALGVVGFAESDLGPVSEIKVKLGVAMANVGNQSFKESLREYVEAHEKAQTLIGSFQENDLVQGVVVMMELLKERLRTFMLSGTQVQEAATVKLGAGANLSLSSSLIQAASFSLTKAFGESSEPKFSAHFSFVVIPPGEFVMGSPTSESERNKDENQHTVILTEEFEMQTTEVTQELWSKVMGSNPSKKGENFSQFPVTDVSWNDVQKFLSELNRLKEGEGYLYRLPTEAEWEYAARAQTTTRYSFGDSASLLSEYGWVKTNHAYPGAAKKPNPWGLYDMHGNVSEWVSDVYGDYESSKVTDPKGANESFGRYYVFRSGNWYGKAEDARSAARKKAKSDTKGDMLGFRLVRTRLK